MGSDAPRISVVVCSHNPRPAVFEEVLGALRAQTHPVSLWDLLIVDNASAPPIAGFASAAWHPRARIVREETLGLVAARLRGVAECAGDLLVFVDDDNLPAPDYLAQAARIGHEWPRLGAWGGAIVPRFETEPAEHVKPWTHWLSLREPSQDRWGNVRYQDEITPWGAGLCLRRAVADDYRRLVLADERRLQLGRRGSALSSAEDLDMVYHAIDMGFGSGVFVALRIVHVIAASRLDEGHILRLCEGDSHSKCWLRHLRGDYALERPSLLERLKSALVRSWPIRRLRFGRMRRLLFEAHLRGLARADREIRAEAGRPPGRA